MLTTLLLVALVLALGYVGAAVMVCRILRDEAARMMWIDEAHDRER